MAVATDILQELGKIQPTAAQLQKDAEDPDIKKALNEAKDLSHKLGLQGTPLFLIGDRVIQMTFSISSRQTSPRSGRTVAQAPVDERLPVAKAAAELWRRRKQHGTQRESLEQRCY